MLYEVKNLVRTRQREQDYKLLIRNLQIRRGDKIALIGQSGCGKSTTLDILGLSLRPDSAELFNFTPEQEKLDIMELWANNQQETLADLRLLNLGYVLQSGELLPYLTTGENMVFTARLAGNTTVEAQKVAGDLAELLGITHLWNALPKTLSVGERQRAAIVRALASKPQVILADEPTAALDPLHADKVMEAFFKALDYFGSTLVLVTHNAQWAKKAGMAEVAFRLEETESGVVAIVDNSVERADEPVS